MLGFLFMGGRVEEGGGLVSGSETWLVSTHTELLVFLLLVSLLDDASNSVNICIPSSLDLSEGSSGGKDDRGALKGLVQVLMTGGTTEEEDKNGLKDVLCFLLLIMTGRLWCDRLFDRAGGLGGGDLGLGGRGLDCSGITERLRTL